TRLLLNESAHFESWTSDHELHAFNALWDMDEIMAANFMVFADVVEAEDYDLWIGDEGWDLDYYLHENPNLKKAPYVFVTDFIGVLPMRDDRSSTEFRRSWEKNAENIDHLRLHPDVRDLSIMVGDEADVLDREFGPELPNMRQWVREHFQFSGYTYHFDPTAYRDRQALRKRLGYRDREREIPGWRRRAARRPRPPPPRAWCGGPPRGSIRASCRRTRGSRCGPSSPTSTSTTRRSIWPSRRAASPPRWSWRPSRRRSSLSRCAITSSSSTSSPAAWSGWVPGCGWTTTGPLPRAWAPRWSPTSVSRCATL